MSKETEMIKNGKIVFKEADRVFNEFASEMAISGPTPDTLFHITFFTDRVDLISQTATADNKEKGAYKISFGSDDSVAMRVKVGSCSLTQNAYYGLFGAMIDRAKIQGTTDKLRDILEAKGLIGNSKGVISD